MNHPTRKPIALIAIGSSTGGAEVLRQIISQLKPGCPPVVIAHHIPGMFTAYLAQDLDKLSQLTVREAKSMDFLKPEHCYLCPGGSHIVVRGNVGAYSLHTHQGRSTDIYKPSIDMLMFSMANTVGNRGLGVILTGMGKDGARGLLEMHANGAYTIAQDQESSVVYGMPKAAAELNAAIRILPGERIGDHINIVVAARSSR